MRNDVCPHHENAGWWKPNNKLPKVGQSDELEVVAEFMPGPGD